MIIIFTEILQNKVIFQKLQNYTIYIEQEENFSIWLCLSLIIELFYLLFVFFLEIIKLCVLSVYMALTFMSFAQGILNKSVTVDGTTVPFIRRLVLQFHIYVYILTCTRICVLYIYLTCNVFKLKQKHQQQSLAKKQIFTTKTLSR